MVDQRGHEAESPWQVSVRGWMDILRRAWTTSAERNLSLVAGGVAYYVLLALFPTLAALVSIYGLVANPVDVVMHTHALSGILPASAVAALDNELHQLSNTSSKSLGLGAVIGFFIAVWSALRGMRGFISALNIAYGQPERRGFFQAKCNRRSVDVSDCHRRSDSSGTHRGFANRAPSSGNEGPDTLDWINCRMAISDSVFCWADCADLPLWA